MTTMGGPVSDSRLDRARRRERGASALEYVGVALIVAVVIASVVIVITPGSVGAGIQRAWCLITSGQSCPALEKPIDALLPECEINSTEFAGEVEASVFSVNLGANGTATMATVKNADGETKYTVSFSGGGKLGAHVMFGEKGEFGLGEGLSAEAKAAYTAEGGVTFEFDSQEEAKNFIKGTAKEAAKWAVAVQAGPLMGPVKGGLDWLTGSYNPPAPKEYYVQLGTKGSAEVVAAAGPEAKLSVEGTHALGMKVSPARDGQSAKYTVYYKGSQELAAELGLGGSGEVEVQVAVTYQDGKPVSAAIEGAGKISSAFLASGEGANKIPLGPKAAGAPSVGIGAQGIVKGKVALELDLTNPDNMNAFADALQSTGMPILPNNGTPGYQDPVTAVQALADRFTKAGPRGGATLTAQKFEGTALEGNAGLWAGDLLAFGAGLKGGMTGLQATDAAYYDPTVGGMVLWRRCAG